MRIALLTELFPPSVGGQEVRFAELADSLAQRGHDVHVMCIRHTNSVPEQERLPSGVTVVRRPFAPDYRRGTSARLSRSPAAIVRYALAARKWLSQAHFDAIFLNQWPLLHVVVLSARDRRKAVVDWCEIRNHQPFQLFQHWLPRMVTANTAVSAQVGAHVSRRSSGPVMVLPSGIERATYYAADPNTRRGILYIGRVAVHKDVPLLVATYDALCRRGSRDPLTIAGDGPAMSKVEAAVEVSPNRGRITLEGMVSEVRKRELLASARVLVLPSKREGFPRVVAEAMASGLPTVTTLYPGNGTVSVVDSYGCGLCAAPTPDDLAEAIGAVQANWHAFSERALEGAGQLDWGHITAEFERFLRQALNAPAMAGANTEPTLPSNPYRLG